MARKVGVYEGKNMMTKFLSFVLFTIISHPENLLNDFNAFLPNCVYKHQVVKNLGINPMLFKQFFITEATLLDSQINLDKYLVSHSWYIPSLPIHQLFILTFSESTAVFSSSSSFTLSWHFCLISA